MKFEAPDASPALNVIVDNAATSVAVSQNTPLLTSVAGIDLVNPISLNQNLIIGSSTTQSPKALLQLLNGTEVTGFSSGTDGKKSIVVAIVDGVLDEAVPSPFTFLHS